MPRAPKPRAHNFAPKTLLIDNGAYNIKAGFASELQEDEAVPECHLIPNALIRDRTKHTWVGDQFERCQDFRELLFRRPMEKGFIVNWEVQREIWDHAFFDAKARLLCDPQETNLVLTEAPNAPQALQSNCDQMVFEEFEFCSYYRTPGPPLNAWLPLSSTQASGSSQKPVECALVVDCGYSHTTITPTLSGRAVQPAVRRLDIGGKLLTNFLKENVSLRSYNMMEETYIMNEMKEKTSFVAGNFAKGLDRTWKGGKNDSKSTDSNAEWNPWSRGDLHEFEQGPQSIVADYVLPVIENRQPGFMRQHDPLQALKLKRKLANGHQDVEAFITIGNERFAGPELLFHPHDIGMKQKGLHDLILESVNTIPEGLRPAMFANIILVGGTSYIAGLEARLNMELRKSIPDGYSLSITRPADPVKSTWQGAFGLASNQNLRNSVLVSRQEYFEHGGSWLARKFSGIQ